MSVPRITISRNVQEVLELAEMIYRKHQELGKNSPLNTLDWTTQGPKVATALAAHRRAEELKRQAERAYEERDAMLKSIDEIVKQTRDVLKGVYRNEPKKLGEFGFDVINSVRPKKETEVA